jgi:hypothetical protein
MVLVVAVVVIWVCVATGDSTVLTLIDSLGLLKRARSGGIKKHAAAAAIEPAQAGGTG